MKYTTLATYERKSTLWRNANAIYKSTDWVKMECKLCDKADERKFAEENGITVSFDGKDVTDEYNADTFDVILTNKSDKNIKCFSFKTKDEANEFFKSVFYHKVLTGWKRV